MNQIANCKMQNANCKLRAPQLCVLVMAIFVAGCGKSGPDLAPVSGRVTLDGRPLESTDVTFQPDGMKSPSVGRTDKDGRYEVGYKRSVQGALIGWHKVRIRTVTEITRGPQLVPARYNTDSNLRREVSAGKNEFDFELTTKKE